MKLVLNLSLLCLFQLSLITPSSGAQFYGENRSTAENPVQLHLFPEAGKLHGWISGVENHSGKKVKVSENGKRIDSIKIDGQNRFQWSFESQKKNEDGEPVARMVTLSYAGKERAISLPPTVADQPVAFFVVDRSVFRPRTELKFAAFLRERDEQGIWKPFQNDSALVEIRSLSKDILVAKLEMKPDAFGRIAGSYQFSKADPHDDYRISVKGAGGSATVKVAEFRKAKVRLDISSERKGEELTLRFRALDFLNKPVPASKLRFTAQVMRKPSPATDLWGLKPEFYPGWEEHSEHWYRLSAEQQALRKAGEIRGGIHAGTKAVHTISEEFDVGEDGEIEHTFTLDPSWLRDHLVEVNGVLIDANNREQKASKSLKLDAENQREILEISISDEEVTAGQEIKLKASTSSNIPVTFAAFRLRAAPANDLATIQPLNTHNPFLTGDWNIDPFHGQVWHRGNQLQYQHLGRGRFFPGYYQPQMQTHEITREFITLKPGKQIKNDRREQNQVFDHQNSLILTQPGAYVLQAITHDLEGNELRSETLVVVHPKERTQGLYLSLENDRLEQEDKLRGSVQSRWTDARVLLVIRDGNGVRSLLPITLDEGRSDFEIPLPERMTLGCELSVRYADSATTMNIDRRRFLVAPPGSDLEVTSKVPETVEPGEEVEIEFQVNRKEKVDLVVSVYDQSLLGIAPERPVDGRSLFHADLRVESNHTRNLLETYLGGFTANTMRELFKETVENEEKKGTALWQIINSELNHLNNRSLYEQALRTFLAMRGAPIHVQTHSNYWTLQLEEEEMDLPLLELIKRQDQSYNAKLKFDFFGDHLAISTEQIVNGIPQPFGYDPIFLLNDWTRYGMFGQLQSGIHFGRSGIATRGDSHFSYDIYASANSSFSSGQAMISHLAPLQIAPMAAPDGIAATTIRRDFSDSAFFNAKVRTNDKGVAKIKVKLPDSLTNWQVVATAVTRDLQIERHTNSFKTYKPVMIWPMLSQSFTSGDRARIFATVHNHTNKEQEFRVSTTVKNGTVHGDATRKVSVPPNSNAPVYFDFEAGKMGFTEILMAAKCAAGEDASLKRLPVNPCSAEQVITRSGFVKDEDSFKVPEGVDLTQARLEVTISPTLAGDMLDSLEYLIAYPHGCVEQTMSRFLPTIKVAQILERFEIEDPKLTKLVPEYSEAGIKRLLQLQQEDGGWGWNGNSGTHEMMTPYALFGLVEAQKAGFAIPNENAIPRGMDRLAGFINGMGDSQAADRVYCMWVFSQYDKMQDDWWAWMEDIVARTLATPKDQSKLFSDYASALALEMAVADGRDKLADRLAQLLVHRAEKNGSMAHWTTANFSRWGNDRFEITAAVLKGFAAYDPEHKIVPSILNYFLSTKRGKRWNSTKDTAMILYAMCDYLAALESDGDYGSSITEMSLNGTRHKLENPDWKPATLVIEGADLKEGANSLEFLKGDRRHVYRMVFRYWREGSDVAPLEEGATVARTFELIDANGQHLRTLKNGDSVPRGSYIRSTLSARLTDNQGGNRTFSYTLSANPKVSCGEYTPLHEQQSGTNHVLKESKALGTYWHHEQGNNNIRTVQVCRAELVGEFLIAPAYVELMYDTEVRGHSGSFLLKIEEEG